MILSTTCYRVYRVYRDNREMAFCTLCNNAQQETNLYYC